MWHTSRGDRTLDGDEAVLVSRAIEVMVGALLVHVDDELEDTAADCESGIAVYDCCTPAQRIGLLHDVARYLLTDTERALPLSALVEGTVAAIFVEIRDQIAIEIGFDAEPAGEGRSASGRFCDVEGAGQPSHRWRQMVLSAHRLVFPFREQEERDAALAGFDASSQDLRQWEILVDELCDSILWDRDFEMADGFLDIDPGVSRQRRRLLGIDDDYFMRLAPDPRPEEAYRLASRTREIVRAKPR